LAHTQYLTSFSRISYIPFNFFLPPQREQQFDIGLLGTLNHFHIYLADRFSGKTAMQRDHLQTKFFRSLLYRSGHRHIVAGSTVSTPRLPQHCASGAQGCADFAHVATSLATLDFERRTPVNRYIG
jgi:hypothetical protein